MMPRPTEKGQLSLPLNVSSCRELEEGAPWTSPRCGKREGTRELLTRLAHWEHLIGERALMHPILEI